MADVGAWLGQPEKPDLYLHSTLYAKVVPALRSGRAANDILDTQRAEHLRLMHELTQRKLAGNLADQLVCDHALFHLEADLRWLELTAARLDELAGQVMVGLAPRTSRCCPRRSRRAPPTGCVTAPPRSIRTPRSRLLAPRSITPW